MEEGYSNINDKGNLGEAFVNQIAYRSFLKYWCFPGPLDITGDYKEICDLLVIFDTTCIIVSVKNYDFKDDYSKYFKKTTEKAIRQINGAERKLFGEREILLKHPDRKEMIFEKTKIKEIYRLVINLNTSVKYYRTSFFENSKHYTVLDADAWEGAMSELNSLPDFLDYIRARCHLFAECPTFILPRSEYDFNVNAEISASSEIFTLAEQKNRIVIINGSELDLIAFYIKNVFSFPDYQAKEGFSSYVFDLNGEFLKYQRSEASKLKLEYEREGYFIDELVREAMLDHKHGYRLAEMLLKLNRFDRAKFARSFLEFHDKYRTGDPTVLMHTSHVVVAGLPLIFLYYDEKCAKEEIDTFIYCRILHYHYLTNREVKEIGVLGMSRIDQRFVFGHSRLETVYSKEEIEDMEAQFKELGWKLREELE